MSHHQRYKMVLSYEGTRYHGWQQQRTSQTIQDLLQKAIKIVLKEEVAVTGAGRTDSGVHALKQIAHFDWKEKLNKESLLVSLNGILPHDIRVNSLQKVPLTFHARYSALSKIYCYHLSLEKFQNPFKRAFSWHIQKRCDLDLLKQAAQLFVGTHDFTSFANLSLNQTKKENLIRTLKRLDIISQKDEIKMEFEGQSFLYKQVRNIVGTLLEVATGKRKLEEIPLIFEAKDRKKAGRAAPAHGLFLVKVKYPLK